jgi:hypothetical protein
LTEISNGVSFGDVVTVASLDSRDNGVCTFDSRACPCEPIEVEEFQFNGRKGACGIAARKTSQHDEW